MSDHEHRRLAEAASVAFERYTHMKINLRHRPDVVEHSRSIWSEAAAELLKHERSRHLE